MDKEDVHFTIMGSSNPAVTQMLPHRYSIFPASINTLGDLLNFCFCISLDEIGALLHSIWSTLIFLLDKDHTKIKFLQLLHGFFLYIYMEYIIKPYFEDYFQDLDDFFF